MNQILGFIGKNSMIDTLKEMNGKVDKIHEQRTVSQMEWFI